MKKTYYFILIASGSWLMLYQIIVWILYAATKSVSRENADPSELEYLNYLVSLLTTLVSLFTVFTSAKQLKLLNKSAKAK
ncbi:hypothetical protein E4631_12310 [Hymenobacter sp. UV11]|uniref:hypothetical protein n=1 Tax=Hymenobacter sp. UV11 TaxID=1849735 RepID=UPI001061543C|nr:hypothetical protein [Hymenobacter sp. UV11]TDN39030.1 hypothetical protein A8B98_21290 [Hymenobacter sp. UV11]TFZ65883.1 hypothetical protein E4631_12310 [Hymenobacter sp. UV11]